MSNKLTQKDVTRYVIEHRDRGLWDSIQAHTAECVDEAVAKAVAEVKKTHYEIGEKVQLQDGVRWVEAVVEATSMAAMRYTRGPSFVRRPPRTRKMTPDEIRGALEGAGLYDMKKYRDETLEAMSADLGISIEVEVE